MKLTAIPLIAVAALLGGCYSWPQPKVEWYHAASQKDANEYMSRVYAMPGRYEGRLNGQSNGPAFARKGTRWVLESVKPDRIWTKTTLGGSCSGSGLSRA